MVPIAAIESLFDKLRPLYMNQHANPDELLTLKSWPETGAPSEHAGFGKMAAQAKALQTAFLEKWLV